MTDLFQSIGIILVAIACIINSIHLWRIGKRK